MKKYYFVNLELTSTTPLLDRKPLIEKTLIREISDIHPLEYEITVNEKNGLGSNGITFQGFKHWEDIKIISWQELTEEEYLKFKDHF